MTIKKLILVRHGESEWNKENRFTGWADVDLSEKGRVEAQQAGNLLKKKDSLLTLLTLPFYDVPLIRFLSF